MKNKDRNTLPERICRALDLPADVLPRHTTVEIHGRSSVKICGGGAILLYSPSEIRIALRAERGWVSVKGTSLCCNSYNSGAVGIDGRVCSVSFESEEHDEKKKLV